MPSTREQKGNSVQFGALILNLSN
ncbi:hypothetical protein EMIT0P176_20266 [Pseudomonas sp. IT-P176]